MLTGHEEHLVGLDPLDDLIGRIELLGLGQLCDVAGVQHQCRRLGHCIQAVHGELQRGGYILIGGLAEANVAVADLREEDLVLLRLIQRIQRRHGEGFGNASTHDPDDAGAGPSHAFEEAATVYPVVLVVVFDIFTHMRPAPSENSGLCGERQTSRVLPAHWVYSRRQVPQRRPGTRQRREWPVGNTSSGCRVTSTDTVMARTDSPYLG